MPKKNTIDMTTGSISKKILLFALPLIASNILQLLFNFADVAVLGAFIEDSTLADNAVAAVGSNAALINLILSLFIGLSVGCNVVIAKNIGKKDYEAVSKGVGTAVLTSLVAGVLVAVFGICLANTFLRWMNCDPSVIDLATTYLTIYFAGMPVIMLYNFTSSVLRADGDTFHPMLFISIGGAINVVLNIFFVAVCKLNVEGVAIATVASNAFAGVACLIVLLRHTGVIKLKFKYLKFDKEQLLDIVKVGLPSGIQSSLFGFSNVIMQSSINAFGPIIMTANTIGTQVGDFIFFIGQGISLATLSFVSQNYGAGNYERIRKIPLVASGWVVLFCSVMSAIILIFPRTLTGLLSDTPAVIDAAVVRLYVVAPLFFMCVLQDLMSNALKGMNRSLVAMFVSLFTSCILRILFIKTVFEWTGKNLMVLYTVWPGAWVLAFIIYLGLWISTLRKYKKTLDEQLKQN